MTPEKHDEKTLNVLISRELIEKCREGGEVAACIGGAIITGKELRRYDFDAEELAAIKAIALMEYKRGNHHIQWVIDNPEPGDKPASIIKAEAWEDCVKGAINQVFPNGVPMTGVREDSDQPF
jgi:hypothetical protein